MDENSREKYKRYVLYGIRLPVSMILIPIGYIFEFLIGLPFLLIGLLDDLFKKKA